MIRPAASLMLALLTAILLPPPARAQDQAAFLLSSPEFTDGGVIPAQYTCDKQGESVPLHWENVPEHTQTFALSIVDPDAPGGTHVHWIAYNLPAKARDLPAAASALPGLGLGAEQGLNTDGKASYSPPCPPTGEHHYIFRLYALDTTLDLPTGTTVDKKAFDAAIQGHVLAQSELTARYAHHP